jgi:prepilin-type N-terminal cleavage/methylation domain-containing protein
MRFKTNKGFSLMEILVVVSIAVVLVVSITVSFAKFSENQIIKSTVSEVLSELDEARALTLASYDDTVYGVHIESDEITFFKGDTYSAVDEDNEVTELSARVSISDISLYGGGDDIIFQRLTGKTDQYGTLTVSLVSDPTETKIITIQESGIIESDI